MQEKRVKHQSVIVKQKEADEKAKIAKAELQAEEEPVNGNATNEPQEEADDEMVQEAFSTVIAQKKRNTRRPYDPSQPKRKKIQERQTKDEENFIPYMAKDYQTESGQVA